MELTKKELNILKSAINSLISQRISYGLVIMNEDKQKDNEIKMKEEYELLDRVITELKNAE